MQCNAMHPIQDLFLEGFSYVIQIDMHFICTPMWTKFYSCENWVLHIVTVNGFQAVGMLIVQPQSQASKVLKHLILALQEENPRVMRVVTNDDKNVPLASHGANPRRTDSVHME
jgi:hypothetical protein